MDFDRPEDFYAVYDRHRTYVRAEIRRKHLAEFGRNLWRPAGFRTGHRVLELGCGVGLFLAYLDAMGVGDFHGVEMDPAAKAHTPAAIADHITTASFASFFATYDGAAFDRVVLLDVFEHFTPGEGVALLKQIAPLLAEDGQIVLRIPNMASPWGLQYQFGDHTHKAFYAPGNIRQLALAADMECLACRPYSRGSLSRRFTNSLVERALTALLVDPPPLWSATFVAVLAKNRAAAAGA